ncbi:hypothetical protein GCM10011321_11110 [Youhaiella tibetensis]|nr:hypothetical protein GCM10011321_11110 [Youhaiella tibetensis]
MAVCDPLELDVRTGKSSVETEPSGACGAVAKVVGWLEEAKPPPTIPPPPTFIGGMNWPSATCVEAPNALGMGWFRLLDPLYAVDPVVVESRKPPMDEQPESAALPASTAAIATAPLSALPDARLLICSTRTQVLNKIETRALR